ncbi:hypothetical protein KKG61_04165 [bacterium]|nr:hypothetical protein [bacterium]
MRKYNGGSIVLKDIHELRRDISKETKGMTAREEVSYWQRIAEEGLKGTGYEYIIVEDKRVLKKQREYNLCKLCNTLLI